MKPEGVSLSETVGSGRVCCVSCRLGRRLRPESRCRCCTHWACLFAGGVGASFPNGKGRLPAKVWWGKAHRADEEEGTEGCSTSRGTRCAYHRSAPCRARDCPLAMKHAAGWLGDEHAKLSTQKNQAVVYVSGRTQHTLSLPPSLSRRGQ